MRHITQWLNKIAEIKTTEDRTIEVWKLNHAQDGEILSVWAKHFREHYCPDSIIDALISGTGLSRKDYLEQMILPDSTKAPGPSIRSGDFGELLVADYIEFTMGYWVPRIKMGEKAVRNESIKGCDIIGFKIENADNTDSPNDELTIYECKASLSGTSAAQNTLQTAVDHSAKDILRKAEALNFLKRKLIEKNDQMWQRVERFQNPVENPYLETNGAAAILSSNIFDQMTTELSNTIARNHPNHQRLRLLIIHGEDLMPFVHALYERMANEA